MTIGNEGEYLFSFNIAGRSDFIQESELVSFKIVEEAGNILPVFELTFNTLDESVLSILQENNTLKVSYGKNNNDLIDSSLSILKLQSKRIGDGFREIYVGGSLAKLGYSQSDKLFISENKSGIEVISDIASQNFTVINNVSQSADSQRWIQNNISDRKFINEIWLHSDLDDSFPLLGITSDSKFIIKDFKETLKSSFDWKFTNTPDLDSDITYDADYEFSSNSGLINAWTGYGREQLVYNLEDNSDSLILEKIEPVIALTNRLARQSDVLKKFTSVGMQNDNIHANYYSSFQKNLAQLSGFGNVRLNLSFQQRFEPVKILDLVMFKDIDIQSSSKRETSEIISGLYFINKVTRTVENRLFATTVGLCRESLNKIIDET